MKLALFLVAFALSASCCGYADDVVPQPASVEDVQVETQPEGQVATCDCVTSEEEACKCGCNKPEEVACSRCGHPHAAILADCGCKKNKKLA